MNVFPKDYEEKLRQEWDAFTDTAAWREWVKMMAEYRRTCTGDLEDTPLKGQEQMYFFARKQGEIAGMERALRMLFIMLGRDNIVGITGVIPGFKIKK